MQSPKKLFEEMNKDQIIYENFNVFRKLVYQIRDLHFPKISEFSQIFKLPNSIYIYFVSTLINFTLASNFLRNIINIQVDYKKKDKILTAVIFFSDWQANALIKSKSWFIDATFDYCPGKFYQLFSAIIKDEISGIYTPGFWVFMSGKKKELYDSVFPTIKQWFLTNKNQQLSPVEITVDFEIALHLSVRLISKSNVVISIYYRPAFEKLKQKKILSFTKKLIQNFKIAVHLPTNRFRELYLEKVNQIIIENNELQIDVSFLSKFKTFFTYVQKTYFDKTSPFSQYIIYKYKIFIFTFKFFFLKSEFIENEDYTRTNNIIEGNWNRFANRCLYKRSREAYVILKLREESKYFEERAKGVLFPAQNTIPMRLHLSDLQEKIESPIISKTKIIVEQLFEHEYESNNRGRI